MYRLMPFTRRALSAAAAVSSLAIAPGVAVAQGGCAAGETTLRTGDARLASFRPLAADSIDMTLDRQGASQPYGTYSQRVERTTLGGRPALLFVQRSNTTRGAALDSIWAEPGTWAPLRHVAVSHRGGMDVSYANDRITGRVTVGDSTRAVDAAVPAGLFDNSVVTAAVSSARLCQGAMLRVAGWDPEHGVRTTEYHILRADRVEIGGAMRDVWVADVRIPDHTVRMYLDRANGRELAWAMEMPGGTTMRGTSAIFTR